VTWAAIGAAIAWWRPPALLREVLVNLVSDRDTALRGVLWRARGPWLVLRHVQLLKAQAKPLPIDGEVIVHRTNVSFLQVLP
jgi:hypothetical protein